MDNDYWNLCKLASGEVTRENASQIEGSLAEIKDEVQRAQQNYSKLLSIVTNEHHGCSDLLTQRFISEVASDLSRLANMSQALDHFPAPQPREVQS